MLWDVAPVRIRLPARERATTAEILDHATALLQRCGTGRGAEVLGHPLAPLGSHANLLAERGETLKAGMTVITGSLSPPPRSVGATAPMAIGGLGEAHLTVLKACKGAGRARNALKKDGTMMLQGKRAIVLGGSSGIGLATTNQLASAGATVIAASRQPQRAQESVRAGVELQVCDVQDREALRALFAASAPFDILVNAATGGTRAMGPFLQMDLDGYRGSFAKLWGYTNAVRLAAEHMDERGTMVLVSGTPARRAKPGQVSLASVGGAVEAFCRAVAPELAPRRINVVSPGIIDTPMFGNDMHERQQRLAGATATHPIPRPGTADEVASAIVFLITNDFVTGTTIDVDGGWLLS